MLAIDGGGFDTATESFVSGNHRAASAYDRLTRELAGYGAMAGDDSTSGDFASSYDDAARQAAHALADLVASFAGLGRITHATVTNHRVADARSVIGGAVIYAGGRLPAGGCVEVLPSWPPSSLGGGSPDLPPHIGWILDHVAGFVWPGADTDRLRAAARTWRTAAESLDTVAIYCDAAVRGLWDERSPEVPLAVDATHELRARVRDLATHFVALGSACEAYADQVDDTRERTLELAKWLLEQVVEGVVISVAIGAVTGGAGAAAGLAAVAARVAAESPRFLRLLEALRAVVATTSSGLRATRSAVSAVRLGLAKFTLAGVERGEAGVLGGGKWPRGWLRSHEHSGSHTLARHVGRTDSQLLKRLKDQPGLDHASTFLDEDTAESAIGQALNQHSTSIRTWVQTGKRPLELDTASPRIVGRCAGADGNIVDAHHMRVVLVRDASMPDGYRILTAYLEP
jgi:Bacterial CdiA-CT RNAse A domain